MGKYEPLAEFLKELQEDSWDASFSDIEKVLGFKLPPSAHEHRAWWANQRNGNHSQAKGWIEAGWETREIDKEHCRVRFERKRRDARRIDDGTMEDLWTKAGIIAGIEDRAVLERVAVNALIQKQAGLALADLGGTMPDYKAPARERPKQ